MPLVRRLLNLLQMTSQIYCSLMAAPNLYGTVQLPGRLAFWLMHLAS